MQDVEEGNNLIFKCSCLARFLSSTLFQCIVYVVLVRYELCVVFLKRVAVEQ